LSKLQQTKASAIREWRFIYADPWIRALTLWLPPVLVLVLWWIFSAGLPRELPTAIIDLDRSTLSRELIRDLDASPTMKITSRLSSMQEGTEAMRDGTVYAVVVIPVDFEVHAVRQEVPVVTAYYNSQYLLVAKAIRSSIFQIVTQVSVKLEVASALPTMPVIKAAAARSMPVRAQVVSLYNESFNYAQFLVPGLVAALFQVFLCCLAVVSVGQSFKASEVSDWFGREVWPELTGKLIPYTVIFFIHGLSVLFLFFELLNWPLQGALLPLVPVLLLFVVSCLVLGVFFFVTAFDLELGLIAAGGFSAPSFAFLGVTFPVSDMPVFAQFWRSLMPAGHFIDGFVHQANYAAGAAGLAQPALFLAAYCVLLPVAVFLIKRKIRRLQSEQVNGQLSATA
jgi:ABC-2 type transport system permease protein